MPLNKSDEIRLVESMAKRGDVEHADNCGMCAKILIGAEEAKIELAKDEVNFSAVMERVENRWKQTKYYKFYHELLVAGKSHHEIAFAEKGWEM